MNDQLKKAPKSTIANGKLPLDGESKEAALEAMAAWVSAIADKVNNPIAGIWAAVDMIGRELDGERQGGFDKLLVNDSVRRIKERLRSLSEYVSELADFAKQPSMFPVQLDLRDIFTEVRDDLGDLGGARLVFEVRGDAYRVMADPSRLRVTLRNLVLNGVEAVNQMREPLVNDAVVVVTSELAKFDGVAGVVISVEDNGPGFSRESLSRAGEPFYSTKEAGTGLGLAIARKFVAGHGGRLEMGESSKLGGAKISLFLPAVRR